MATAHHHHHHHHRPVPLSLPSSRFINSHYPSSPFPFSPSYSLSTPSKTRRHLPSSSSSSSSYSSLFLLLLSLRSLYSLLPFLRSSPPSFFLLFPFSFLVSLLSLLLLLPFSSPSSIQISKSHLSPLALSSLLQTLTLLLRFHSLRYCSAAAAILSDLSGSLLASSLLNSDPKRFRKRTIPSVISLLASLFLMSRSWDRVGCSPLSASSPDDANPCDRLLPMLLPFLSGFVSFHQSRHASTSPPLRQLSRRHLRLLSLSFTTLFLLSPAILTFLLSQSPLLSPSVSLSTLGWQLTNIVVFGVVLGESYNDGSDKDFRKEFMVTFFCTLLLELVYVPKLSLPGFLFCGLLLWFSVRELGSSSSYSYVELGSGPDASESLYSMVMNPVRHILSERKSRKIALFLLINAGYMVVEFAVGFMSNSLGLISDACHMLFDCAALAIGLYASYISRLPANHQYNYGRGRFEVLSGYVNAVLLVLVGALIVLESIERILDPQEISTNSLLTVSVGGFLVNLVGLVFFHEEHHHAHGGGGMCSHSHSHPHREHEGVGCNKEQSVEHQKCVEVSHESSNPLTHDSHHHGHSHLESRDHHDHHFHAHQHEHHDHDHHCHGEHGQKHHEHHDIHLDSSESKHEHKKLDVSLKDSHNHSHEGHTHTGCHSANECCSHSGESPEATYTLLAPKNPRKHRHIDHNMEGIFLHVLADTLGSVGVVVSTLLIKYKGWLVADPASSIFISVMIISSVIPLLKNSAEILLQRVPRAHEEDLRVSLDDLRKIRGVCAVRKLHVWNLTNTDIVGTLHLHVSPETDKAAIRSRASELFRDAGIKDLTIQVESMAG